MRTHQSTGTPSLMRHLITGPPKAPRVPPPGRAEGSQVETPRGREVAVPPFPVSPYPAGTHPNLEAPGSAGTSTIRRVACREGSRLPGKSARVEEPRGYDRVRPCPRCPRLRHMRPAYGGGAVHRDATRPLEPKRVRLRSRCRFLRAGAARGRRERRGALQPPSSTAPCPHSRRGWRRPFREAGRDGGRGHDSVRRARAPRAHGAPSLRRRGAGRARQPRRLPAGLRVMGLPGRRPSSSSRRRQRGAARTATRQLVRAARRRRSVLGPKICPA